MSRANVDDTVFLAGLVGKCVLLGALGVLTYNTIRSLWDDVSVEWIGSLV